jgi:hypothetical protein
MLHTMTYSTVINAWVNSNLRESATHAERLICEMEQHCKKGEDHMKSTNMKTCSILVEVLAKKMSLDHQKKLEDILFEILDHSKESCKLDANSVIDAQVKSRDKRGPRKIEDL